MGSWRLKKLRKRAGKKQRNKKARQQAKRATKQRSRNKRRRKNQRRRRRNQTAVIDSYAGYIPSLFAVPPVMPPVVAEIVAEPDPFEFLDQNNSDDEEPQNVDVLVDDAFDFLASDDGYGSTTSGGSSDHDIDADMLNDDEFLNF